MIVRLLKSLEGPAGKLPAGTLHSHPDAWNLVVLGVAEPCDDESRAAARKGGWKPIQEEWDEPAPAPAPSAPPAPPPATPPMPNDELLSE